MGFVHLSVNWWHYWCSDLAYPDALSFHRDYSGLVSVAPAGCACCLEGWTWHSRRGHWRVDCFVFLFAATGIDFAEWTDIVSPSLALGQAIGRWGNFFNQELYGAPTNLPWKLYIDPAHRLADYTNVNYYHPLFLYESLWNLMNMFLLLWISRRFANSLKNGDVFLVYLIVYPVGRFLLDFLRLDASLVGGININQSIMAVVAVCAATALYLRHRKA